MSSRIHRAFVSKYSQVRSHLVVADRGAEMAEYGMLLFFVGIASFGILALFGGEVWELFTATETEFDAARKVPPAAD